MKKEYKELMEMVEVDEAMHERIVSHVHDYINQESRTVFSWLEMRKWATAVSVCLLIAVVGLGSQWLNSLKPTNDSGPIFGGNGIVEVESLDALTAQSGLPIQELHHLPFEVETVSYSLYWGELAQIVYEGAEQSCTLRLSLG